MQQMNQKNHLEINRREFHKIMKELNTQNNIVKEKGT